jgi:hypothetical protein
MSRKSEAVNLVNFVHLKRNDQRLSYGHEEVAAEAPWQLYFVGSSRDPTADCFRLWLSMLPVQMICRDGFH